MTSNGKNKTSPEEDYRRQRRRQVEQELQNFLGDRSWKDVYREWRKVIDGSNVEVGDLFYRAVIFDSETPKRTSVNFSWWPKSDLVGHHAYIQEYFNDWPGTRGLLHYYDGMRKGELDTVGLLWKVRDNPELICTVLVMASIFGRSFASRGRAGRNSYPYDLWPPEECVREIFLWGRKKLLGEDGFGMVWHSSCTQVLPLELSTPETGLVTFEEFVEFLAKEHVYILNRAQPVVRLFSETMDPKISEALEERRKKAEREAEEYRLAHEDEWREAREKEEIRKAREEKRSQAPRCDDWFDLTEEELKQLVWSKPTVELAKEFGISDVAISKRCKKWGISKPPLGYWARVRAGKIPHPNGKPPGRR